MAKRIKNVPREFEDEIRENDFKIYENNSNSGILKKSINLNDINLSKIKCLNETQKLLKKSINEKDIVISSGPAGTGKTFIALLTALSCIKSEPKYRKLILIKSLQVIDGESVGYLKGTLAEKIEPYMYSFIYNLDRIFGSKQITKSFFETGLIEFQPIAFCRGVTFSECIVILDEMQNITMGTFKTLITRIGYDCKMIFLGDTNQIDLKNKGDSCINKVLEIFKNKEFINVIQFKNEESVRNPLIPEIIKIIEGNI
jgi:phosphate starvation-inducible protein PhoH and related proteins